MCLWPLAFDLFDRSFAPFLDINFDTPLKFNRKVGLEGLDWLLAFSVRVFRVESTRVNDDLGLTRKGFKSLSDLLKRELFRF